VSTAHVGDKAAKSDPNGNDEYWKYSSLELRIAIEMKEEKTGNA